jgi:hypothetical protein
MKFSAEKDFCRKNLLSVVKIFQLMFLGMVFPNGFAPQRYQSQAHISIYPFILSHLKTSSRGRVQGRDDCFFLRCRGSWREGSVISSELFLPLFSLYIPGVQHDMKVNSLLLNNYMGVCLVDNISQFNVVPGRECLLIPWSNTNSIPSITISTLITFLDPAQIPVAVFATPVPLL